MQHGFVKNILLLFFSRGMRCLDASEKLLIHGIGATLPFLGLNVIDLVLPHESNNSIIPVLINYHMSSGTPGVFRICCGFHHSRHTQTPYTGDLLNCM